MRNGDARQFIEFLNAFGSPVTQEEHESGGNSRCGQAHHQVAGNSSDQGAEQGIVPEVPHVNVEGLGDAQNKRTKLTTRPIGMTHRPTSVAKATAAAAGQPTSTMSRAMPALVTIAWDTQRGRPTSGQ